ncbi:MAG: hypothetical protein IKX20_08795 [Paludibacteraceae bacterium]|nr:hypothetical protein [Paludibacteraceae bacterium]
MSLQNKLYKEILLKEKELEALRKNGGKVNVEWDLPKVAVACKYNGVERCGFSCNSNHVSRSDIIRPFYPLLERELLNQAPEAPKLPYVVFKKKRQPVVDMMSGDVIRYKKVVEKFIGTCAEDNAANCVLFGQNGRGVPQSLKDLSFVHPIRPRTLMRVRMCDVCRTIFTEP